MPGFFVGSENICCQKGTVGGGVERLISILTVIFWSVVGRDNDECGVECLQFLSGVTQCYLIHEHVFENVRGIVGGEVGGSDYFIRLYSEVLPDTVLYEVMY